MLEAEPSREKAALAQIKSKELKGKAIIELAATRII